MKKIISKEEFDRFMALEGEVRGDGMKNYLGFIFKEEGSEGVRKVEEIITELGYPFEYKRIKPSSFYPLGLEEVVLLAIRRVFNYNDEKFQEMGTAIVRRSIFIRLLLKYFFSPEKMIEKSDLIWKRAVTVGSLKVTEYSKEKRYAIFRVYGFNVHPIHCQLMKGLFTGVVQMIIGKVLTCEETACPLRGGGYHEFLLKW